MSHDLEPLLLPAVLSLSLKQLARDFTDPMQFKAGSKLQVIKTISGRHQWDRGMACGLATVTFEPGDLVRCAGRDLNSDLSVLPMTEDMESFVKRAVNAEDQAYVERGLLVNIDGKNLNEFFIVIEA